MKQRLSLARTIIHQPLVLLLDEPVSGLDPLARREFCNIVNILKEAGMTILISSHILSDLAELCTTVGIMELGFLVESALGRIISTFGEEICKYHCVGGRGETGKAIKQLSSC